MYLFVIYTENYAFTLLLIIYERNRGKIENENSKTKIKFPIRIHLIVSDKYE